MTGVGCGAFFAADLLPLTPVCAVWYFGFGAGAVCAAHVTAMAATKARKPSFCSGGYVMLQPTLTPFLHQPPLPQTLPRRACEKNRISMKKHLIQQQPESNPR